MPIQPLNQQTIPATRDIFTANTDVVKTTKMAQEETSAKIKQDQFIKTTNEETTYINQVQNNMNKNNVAAIEKTVTPKTTAVETQKISTGLYNPKEIANQKNTTSEMNTQTKEMARVKANEEITA